MKPKKRKPLAAVGVGAGILAVLSLVLLLFSCGADDAEADVSGRIAQLYPSVAAAEGRGDSASLPVTRPDGYPEEIGGTLAVMMSLYEKDASYLYHVAFRDTAGTSTRESIVGRLGDDGPLYAEAWVELPQESGWYYFLFTAEEIRTLAGAGIECRFIGSGASLPDDGTDSLTWEQAVELICQWAGDSFLASTGE